jgi:CRP-like cAMP-binding protein
LALVTGDAASAEVVASADGVRLACIAMPRMRAMLDAQPRLAAALLALVARRLAQR